MKNLSAKAAFSAAIITLSALLLCGCSKKLDVFGKEMRSDDTEIVFSGDEIESLGALKEQLALFDAPAKVELGTFYLDAKTCGELDDAFPETEFSYRTYIDVCGKRFMTDDNVLDLSDISLRSIADFEEDIPYFTNLEKIDLGKNLIPAAERDELAEKYPDVKIVADFVHDIYGKKLKETSRSIDFTSLEIDDTLGDKLALFPNLTSVDLHGHEFTIEEQLALHERFPEVEFGWTVEFCTKTLDSLDEKIDISGIKLENTEEVEQRIVLFPRCTYLDMCDCGIDNDTMAALREKLRGQGVETVWRLKFGIWKMKTDDVSFSVLVVYLRECRQIHNKDLEVLKYTTNLQALDLGHQSVSDVTAIAEYCPELRILILADDAVKDITPLGKLEHLHYLELFWRNSYSDLTPLTNCKELVDLNISYNYQVKDFSPLKELPMLERLWVEHDSISKQTVAELTELLPNCKIVTKGKGSVDNGWRTHKRYHEMIKMFRNPTYKSEEFFKYDGITDPSMLPAEEETEEEQK